ncbi:MAG: GNAT family N-acetyltransferase [Cyanobacteria bacterium P01_F01_bin.153]
MDIPILETPRLRLREWQPGDRDLLVAMNADPKVMEFMPKLATPAESDALLGRIHNHFAAHGYGFWAVERRDHLTDTPRPFIGFIGLAVVNFDAPFTPAVEIGWRLTAEHWGEGLATEGAKAALKFGFETLELKKIVSFTAFHNRRSWRVMKKLGMQYCSTFEHPKLPIGHPLQLHRLYEINQQDYQSAL